MNVWPDGLVLYLMLKEKFKWLINRLRQMSLAEVIFRFKRALLQKIEKHKVLSGWQPMPVNHVRAKSNLFDAHTDLINGWKNDYQLDKTRLQQYLNGKIDFFGHDYFDIGQPVHWHIDPVTKIKSPLEFGKTLDYRNDEKVGNVKFIWELGRHQHLVPLAVAYAITGDVTYCDAVTTQIDSWIDDNPYAMGIHWCSSLELALRLISWSLVHSLIALRDGEKGLFAAMKNADKLGQAIYQQAYFIRHFLSLHSSANNHLIGELTGLWTACRVFELGKQGNEWADFALNGLENQAYHQVYDDGVDKEQAFYYHLWVLDYFLFAWLIGCHTKKTFSPGFIKKIGNMSAFLRSVSPDGGQPPQIGDADDGFVARFEPKWSDQPYTEILSVIDFISARSAQPATQKAFWYSAIASDQLADAIPDNSWQRQYPEVYQQGGYAVLGNKDCHIVFDGGDLGYLGIAAHGHADALSLCMAIDGDWWLVDPGTFAYHSEARWRNYFRGTRAHNTIKINDIDQSHIAGPFMWSHKAQAQMQDCHSENSRQIITANHNGYDSLGVSHQRRLIFSEAGGERGINELIIEDTLDARSNFKAEINFHFSSDVSLEFDKKNNHWFARHKNNNRELIVILDNCWSVTAVKGQLDPILGWYSPALEEKVETWVLHGEAELTGTTKSISKILIK